MAKEKFEYSGNVYEPSAGTTTFALTSTGGKEIPYLQRSHISVGKSTDDGKTYVDLGRPAAWDFSADGKSVVLVDGTVAGDWIKVKRNTPLTNPYIDFSSGSLLTSEQLNQSEEYSLYCDQELFDKTYVVNQETDALEERVEKNEDDIKDLQDKDSDLDKDIAALDVRVTKNEGDIVDLKAKDTSLDGDIAALDTRVTKNEGDITALDGRVTKNEGDIATNASDIAALDTRVTKNEGDISTNAGNISTNAGNIATNTSNIAKNRTDIDNNADDIKDNANEIADLKTKSGVSKITAGTNVSISPADGKGDVTISADATPYNLPIASASVLGGIKVGANLSISGSGVLSATGGGGGGSTITFKGAADFTGTAPANPAVGDLYLNDTKGNGAWDGFSGVAVDVNDRAFYNGADWDRLPGTGGDQVQSDWNQSNPALVDFIKNKPTIPVVNYPVTSVNTKTGAVVLKTSDLENDSGYITTTEVLVKSVNGKTGEVVLSAGDVGAATAAQGTKADSALQPGEAATPAQGTKADSAIQPGDNVSTLNNDAGYITSSSIPSVPVQSVNGKTGAVVLNASDVGALPSSTSLAFVPLGSWSSIPTL